MADQNDPAFHGGLAWGQLVLVHDYAFHPDEEGQAEGPGSRYTYGICTDIDREGVLFRGADRNSFILAEELTSRVGLETLFRIAPIRDVDALAKALKVVTWLIDQGELSAAQQDYLEVLTLLVADYEDKNNPRQSVDARRVLFRLMQSQGVSAADAAKACHCDERTIVDLVVGGRPFNRVDFICLAKFFGESPTAFMPRTTEIKEQADA